MLIATVTATTADRSNSSTLHTARLNFSLRYVEEGLWRERSPGGPAAQFAGPIALAMLVDVLDQPVLEPTELAAPEVLRQRLRARACRFAADMNWAA